MKLLISGFEPFGGQEINPAKEVLAILPDRLRHPKSGEMIEIVKTVIPTAVGTSLQKLKDAVEAHRPDAVVSLGQAGGRTEITLEALGTNEADFPIPDNDGNAPRGEAIVSGAADAYFTTIPNKAIVQSLLRRGIPASVSRSAGTYVCNYICYGICEYLKDRPHIMSGFIHVPYLPEQVARLYAEGKAKSLPSMSLEVMKEAVLIAAFAIFDGFSESESEAVDAERGSASGTTH